ncbi:MAG: CDP-glycerol glycerophosphotransferase family protein, partial [Lachnospiraceae bacterium]|nr:CDP-glycerol glycerophosphotransferase family protein [Lachnospiraceae bacterium]
MKRLYKIAEVLWSNGWRYLYCISHLNMPINKNRIVFISHKGKQYSCNPMYISEYLQKNYPGRFEIIWAFDKPRDFKCLEEKGIRVVKKGSCEH